MLGIQEFSASYSGFYSCAEDLDGRIDPENRLNHLVEAFRLLDTPMKCVIVGGTPLDMRPIAHESPFTCSAVNCIPSACKCASAN